MRARVAASIAIGAAACTGPAFVWHATQFTKPGWPYLALLCASLAALCASGLVYGRLRWRPRYELLWIAAAPVCIVAAYRPVALAATLAIGVAAWLLGAEILDRLRFDPPGSCARVCMPALAGLGALTFALFAVGTAGLFSRPILVTVVVVAAGTGFRRAGALRSALLDLARAWEQATASREPIVCAVVPFIVALGVLSAVAVVLPSNTGDAMSAHMPLAKSYFASGRLRPPDTLPYGWFPQAFEAWLVVGIAFAGLAGAQAVAALFSAFCGLALVGVLRSSGLSRGASIVGLALAASIPFVHWTASVAKNDTLLAAWQLASLYCVLQWNRDGWRAWIVLSAVFGGLAFEVKHVALFGAVPLAALWAYAALNDKRPARTAAFAAGAFLACATFSVARAWIATGNPVYPETASRSIRPIGHRTFGARVARWFSLPVRLHLDGGKYFESSSPNPLGVAFVVLLVPALTVANASRGRQRRHAPALLFACGYLLYWSVMAPVLRYALPAFAVGAGLLGAPLVEWARERRTPLLATVYVLCFGWTVSLMIESYTPALPWLARRIDDSAYLARSTPGFGAMHYLATAAAPDDRVLSVDNCDVVYGPNPDRLWAYCRDDRTYSPAEIANIVASRPDFGWLVLPNGGTGPQLAAAAGRAVSTEHVYGDPWYSVFRIGAGRIPTAQRTDAIPKDKPL